MGIGPVNADLDVGFDKIWDNLELAGMGSVRVGCGRWALTADVIYMGLQGSKNDLTAELDQSAVSRSTTEPLKGSVTSRQRSLSRRPTWLANTPPSSSAR
jgi:hypothetical protein